MFNKIFEKIIQENKVEYLESGYHIQQFTFGFELEAWDTNGIHRNDLDQIFQKFWDDNIDPNYLKTTDGDMGTDMTISPSEDGMDSDDSISCPECRGLGHVTCYTCGGEGELPCDVCDGTLVYKENCKHCNGIGEDPDGQLNVYGDIADCPICEGEGEIDADCIKCVQHPEQFTNPGVVEPGVEHCWRCYGETVIRCENCYGEGTIPQDVDSFTSYEWGSPITKFTPYILQKTINFLTWGLERKYINTNKTCGFHIHLGFPDNYKRSEDIFWVLCQMVTKDRARMFHEIQHYRHIDLYQEGGDGYAPRDMMENLERSFHQLAIDVKRNIMDKKEEEIALDENYMSNKDYLNNFFLEAKKYKKDISKELNIWKYLFKRDIINEFFNAEKYTILRQHDEHGTLEWRGVRGFLDDKKIEDIKGFFIDKLYPFVKWINEALNEKYIKISGVKLSREAFDAMLKEHPAPAKRIRKEKDDKRFHSDQNKEVLQEIFKKFPINKWKFNRVILDIKKDHLHIEEGVVDFNFNKIPEKIVLVSGLIVKNAIFENFELDARHVKIKNSKIKSGTFMGNNSFMDCVIENGEFHNINISARNTIHNGVFESINFNTYYINDESDKNNIEGGNFSNGTVIRGVNIHDGIFEHVYLDDQNSIYGGEFNECFWDLDSDSEWKDGKWISGAISFRGTRYMDVDINPNEFKNILFKYKVGRDLGYKLYDQYINLPDVDIEGFESLNSYKNRVEKEV